MATTGVLKDVYQEVTDAVMEQMEKGNLVWRCGWNDSGLPSNATTGVCYRGWNVFWLNFHTMLKGYQTSQYLTFKQALDLGGNIKKGEKGIKIIYWATIQTRKSSVPSEIADNEHDDGKHQRLIPKVYTVFNIAQAEGIEFEPPMSAVRSVEAKIAACEDLIQGMPLPPAINLDGQYPVYYPERDEVAVPGIHLFESAGEYYSALFHELAHSTGHARRLNRKEISEPSGFGSEPYSREELTAELTAAFLCAVTGISQQTLENSAAYIQGWLKALKDDKSLLIKAAGQAQKAADYIRQMQYETA